MTDKVKGSVGASLWSFKIHFTFQNTICRFKICPLQDFSHYNISILYYEINNYRVWFVPQILPVQVAGCLFIPIQALIHSLLWMNECVNNVMIVKQSHAEACYMEILHWLKIHLLEGDVRKPLKKKNPTFSRQGGVMKSLSWWHTHTRCHKVKTTWPHR